MLLYYIILATLFAIQKISFSIVSLSDENIRRYTVISANDETLTFYADTTRKRLGAGDESRVFEHGVMVMRFFLVLALAPSQYELAVYIL